MNNSTKDYSRTNPVPQAGDKIRITAVNSKHHYWNVGDVIECVGGKPDFCGKPAFCAVLERERWNGRRDKRRVWNGPGSYDWKIIERDGKPYMAKEERVKISTELRKEYLEKTVSDIISNEWLMQQLTVMESEAGIASAKTADNIVSLAASIADRMIGELQDKVITVSDDNQTEQ